jgi:hypothetical protein
MLEEVKFDVEDEKLVVYIISNYEIKNVEIVSDYSLKIDYEFGSSEIYLPCPPKSVESFENLGSGLYIIKIVPKWKNYLPPSFTDDELHDLIQGIPYRENKNIKQVEITTNTNIDDPALLLEIEEEIEEIVKDLEKELEKEFNESDFINTYDEDIEDDENEEEEGYDLYEEALEDDEKVHDGVVIDTGDDFMDCGSFCT